MGLVPWQATVTNETKQVVPNPVITVRNVSDDSLATLYSDAAGTAEVNPITGDANGFVQFWVQPGEYYIDGAKGGDVADRWYWDAVDLGVTQPFANQAAWLAATIPGTVTKSAYVGSGGQIVELIRDGSGTVTQTNGQTWTIADRQQAVAGGSYLRFLSNKLGDVLSVADFGVQYGDDSDQSSALNSAISAALDQAENVSGNMWTAPQIDLGPGTIRIENKLMELARGISIRGRGKATIIKAYGAFDLFSTQEYESDGTTPRYHWGMRFDDFQVASADAANPLTTIVKARGLIRHSGLSRVIGRGAVRAFDIDRCWTLDLTQCGHEGVNGDTINHALIGANTGAVYFKGGRYDVAGQAGIYTAASDQIELFILDDCAIQFGAQAAVEAAGVRTLKIKDAFLEGNCIGNPSKHHIEAQGSGTSLSSCEIVGTAINNDGDSNRNGLGVANIDGFETVIYDDGSRWVRNGVRDYPKFGSSIAHAHIRLGTSVSLSAADLPFLGAASDNSAVIEQIDRPTRFYGQAMDNGTPAPDTKAAAVFGAVDGGRVSIGEFDGAGALQGHGTGSSNRLRLNPHDGDVHLGQGGAFVPDGTNEFLGRLRRSAQNTGGSITPAATTGIVGVDTSGGNRTVALTNITHVAGREIVVFKRSGDTNSLIITPGSGTINGAANLIMTTAYAAATLVSDGTNWFVAAQK